MAGGAGIAESWGRGPIPPAVEAPKVHSVRRGWGRCIESRAGRSSSVLLPLDPAKPGQPLGCPAPRACRCWGSRKRRAHAPAAPARALGLCTRGRPEQHCPGASAPLESRPWTRLTPSGKRLQDQRRALGWRPQNPTISWSGGLGPGAPAASAAGAPGPRSQRSAPYTRAASSFSGVGSGVVERESLGRRVVEGPLGRGWQGTGRDWHSLRRA